MAIGVIFGLMIATVLTLVVMPSLYALIEATKENFTTGYAKTRVFFLGEPESDTITYQFHKKRKKFARIKIMHILWSIPHMTVTP